MQRLTARFLILFAIIGTFVPLAMALTADPPHACCLRGRMHQCHGSMAAEPARPVVRDTTCCCDHGCCRAVTTSQLATLPVPNRVSIALRAQNRVSEPCAQAPSAQLSTSQPARAPPLLAIA